MPISSGAAGILGAAAGVNAMLRGQIRGEMIRQQREAQGIEIGQRQQGLDLAERRANTEDLNARTRAAAGEPGLEDQIRNRLLLKWLANPSSLTSDERIILELQRAPSQSTGQTSLLDLAIDVANGGRTPEEFEEIRKKYLSLHGSTSLGDQLWEMVWSRVPKTRETVNVTGIGTLSKTDVIRENIPVLDQFNLAIEGYRQADSLMRNSGFLPPLSAIDTALEQAIKRPGAVPSTGPGWQGPLTIEDELRLLEQQEQQYLDSLKRENGNPQ